MGRAEKERTERKTGTSRCCKNPLRALRKTLRACAPRGEREVASWKTVSRVRCEVFSIVQRERSRVSSSAAGKVKFVSAKAVPVFVSRLRLLKTSGRMRTKRLRSGKSLVLSGSSQTSRVCVQTSPLLTSSKLVCSKGAY